MDNESIASDDSPIDVTHLFGCPFHKISFALSKTGQIYKNNDPESAIEMPLEYMYTGTLEDYILHEFPNRDFVQVVNLCQPRENACMFYFRSSGKHVYVWEIDTSKAINSRKRPKLNIGSAPPPRKTYANITMISECANYMLPVLTSGIALFLEGEKIRYMSARTNESNVIAPIYNPLDINITHYQFTKQLDPCLSKFFSLPALKFGIVFGTREGSVYIRDIAAGLIKDVHIMSFEVSERSKFIDVLNMPALSDEDNTIIAFGDQGTIMVYSRASSDSSETNVSFKQFNIPGPIFSVEKIPQKASYLIISELGHISRLDFKCTAEGITMESNAVIPASEGVRKLKVYDSENNVFEAIYEHNGNAVYDSECKYKLVPQANDQQEIRKAIEQALAQLKSSEAEIKKLDEDEQALNKKLMSVNKTLYALRNINTKRKRGIINSLESTGFEFSMRPITLKQSIANSSLHCSSFLRISIKTSRFLELEDWDLQLDFVPKASPSTSALRQTKSVSVMGFEPHFENGIERYAIWERDVEIDLNTITLPVEVSATLVMTVNEPEKPPLLFPVSRIVVDDLHYAIPCTPDFITSIERRGLEDVSKRLMESFHKQKLHDKTGRYPFARLLNFKTPTLQMTSSERLFDYRKIHIKFTVDMHITNDSYRSILPRLLNEGRTMEDVKSILVNAEMALFTLAAFPGCPVIIKLVRASSTLIDMCVHCVYLPALFKVEATLLRRLYQDFLMPIVSGKQDNNFLKKLKSLEDAVIDIQEKYQNTIDDMDVDGENTVTEQLKNAVDVLYSIHGEHPIGHLFHAEDCGE